MFRAPILGVAILCLYFASGAPTDDSAATEASSSSHDDTFSEHGADSAAHEAPICNKLHAIFKYRDTDFFVFGLNYMVGLDEHGDIEYEGSLSDTGFHGNVTAAVGYPYDDMFYLEDGEHEYGYYRFHKEAKYQPRVKSGANAVLEADPDYHGIDAVVMRADDAYYIAGCRYVVVDLYNFKLRMDGSVDELGLPCSPDAAWTSPNGKISFIVKGHRLFLWWLDEDRVGGEEYLFDNFDNLRMLNLCD